MSCEIRDSECLSLYDEKTHPRKSSDPVIASVCYDQMHRIDLYAHHDLLSQACVEMQ